MKIYTRTGDKGQTGIIGGRVNKDDLRVEAYGTVDELNGFVALAHAELDKGLNQDIANDLIKIQHELFDLGGDLASVVEKRPDKMDSEMITYLEEQIEDRKSTRLNSSHVAISYAVFCLKKKKNN